MNFMIFLAYFRDNNQDIIIVQLCILHRWRGHLLELKEAGDNLAVNHGVGVNPDDPCCRGGNMDVHVSGGDTLSLSKLMLSYCNNQSAITVAKDDQFHACMKHINICYHFICKESTWNILEVRYYPTQYRVTDIFTKALPVKTFKQLHMLLSIYVD